MSAHPPCVFCQQPLNTCPPGGIGYINRYDDAGRWAGYAYHAGLGQCLKAPSRTAFRTTAGRPGRWRDDLPRPPRAQALKRRGERTWILRASFGAVGSRHIMRHRFELVKL